VLASPDAADAAAPYSLTGEGWIATGLAGVGVAPLSRSRRGRELLHHAEDVLQVPILGQLVVLDGPDVDGGDLEPLAGRGCPEELAQVGALDGRPHGNRVPGHDQVVDAEGEVRESGSGGRQVCRKLSRLDPSPGGAVWMTRSGETTWVSISRSPLAAIS
jgi:hypothetical protein